jgi:NAD(P)H-hydrate epimerase
VFWGGIEKFRGVKSRPHFPAALPGTLPVLTCAESAAFEKAFFSQPGNEEALFLFRAAAGVAKETAALFSEISIRPVRTVLVLAGTGHNAADALLAARKLVNADESDILESSCAGIKVLLAAPMEKMSTAAATALQILLEHGAQAHPWQSASGADVFLGDTIADVLLDGLLGYNFHPPLREPFADILRWANLRTLARIRVSVDLPSGVGDVPPPLDVLPVVFRADATVACGIVKAPLLDEAHTACHVHRGRLRFVDVGFPEDAAVGTAASANFVDRHSRAANAAMLLSTSPLAQLRPALADKRHFGHLFILGGARDMPGALLLNARAALRAGVGLLTVFCPESVHAAFAAAAPEAMWVPWPEAPDGSLSLEGEHLLRERLPRATALLCGSGTRPEGETLALLQSVAERSGDLPLVLDAGALHPLVLDAARRRNSGAPLVLLPHAGEFARIRTETPETARAGCSSELRKTCARLGAFIALKGAPTRVADATGREIYVCAGGPVLARGGSGDLLAGITGALFARKLFTDPLQTLAAAVAWHGAAADATARLRGAEALATADILDALDVLRE